MSKYLDATASNGKIIYVSSDPSVAKVDENGRVTGVKTGKAVITATVEGTDNSVSCEVTVKYAWWQWIIRILLLGFLWY
ncbi:MAG: Ig-like domain-containing protein [Clostridia bacterium]|nr:Ig-like domain-containing protein [Clostridia bacterium]